MRQGLAPCDWITAAIVLDLVFIVISLSRSRAYVNDGRCVSPQNGVQFPVKTAKEGV